MLSRPIAIIFSLVFLLVQVDANADQKQALADAVNAYSQLSPIKSAPELSLEQAEEVQKLLILTLRPQWGEIVGYKAGLTAKPAQQRFGVEQPVSGVFLENMFTSTGSTIDSNAGVNLLLEADLLVRVKDDSFNQASNAAEALSGLSQVIPFLEIPDLMFAKDVALSGSNIIAINVGARYGVMGAPIALDTLDDAVTRLKNFQVQLEDENGHEIGSGKGEALMGHPLTAAIWLRDSLKRQGIELKAGDLLSLGGMSKPRPLKGLQRVKAIYTGLSQEPVTILIGVR